MTCETLPLTGTGTCNQEVGNEDDGYRECGEHLEYDGDGIYYCPKCMEYYREVYD